MKSGIDSLGHPPCESLQLTSLRALRVILHVKIHIRYVPSDQGYVVNSPSGQNNGADLFMPIQYSPFRRLKLGSPCGTRIDKQLATLKYRKHKSYYNKLLNEYTRRQKLSIAKIFQRKSAKLSKYEFIHVLVKFMKFDKVMTTFSIF